MKVGHFRNFFQRGSDLNFFLALESKKNKIPNFYLFKSEILYLRLKFHFICFKMNSSVQFRVALSPQF